MLNPVLVPVPKGSAPVTALAAQGRVAMGASLRWAVRQLGQTVGAAADGVDYRR